MPSVSLNPHRRPSDTADLGDFARPPHPWAGAKEDRDRASRAPEDEAGDPLLSFDSEHPRGGGAARTAGQPPIPTRLPSPLISPRVIALGLLTFAVGAVGTVSYSRWRGSADPAAAVAPLTSEGRAIINSSPAGALVSIDGVARGTTPLDLLLPPGAHTLQLQNGASIRTLPLEVQASQAMSHYIELPVAAAPPAPRVEVSSRPAPSQPRGGGPARTPPPVPSPQPSQAPPPPAMTGGWAAINVPFTAQVTQNGRTIGTTGASPLALSAGVHTLELANAAFEFRTTLTVAIVAGETTRLSVTLPNGSLSVNALPWAEVFVDGRSIGTTPLANVPVPVGSREILWRHPDFGDRRQLVNVTARSPVRIGTDLRR